MNTTTDITYAVQHPNMSHALLIESQVARTDDALRAWAAMYILRQFDEMLPMDEFVVDEVPAGTDPEFTLFPS
jgi:hypothetical protein